jgi:hypothetical protein
MMGYLPKSNFEWMTKEELQNLSIENIPDDSEWGYTLEVDLHYPDYTRCFHLTVKSLKKNSIVDNFMKN